MKLHLAILLLSTMIFHDTAAQDAIVREEMMDLKTYSFSDPDPIPNISRIYPYYYFHGYTDTPEMKKWKMVILENEYIKVFVCPDIGGKIWGAIEKSTGKEFLYFNHVVKFRDVAMRGAWTSGGLEYNFGDIGHIPTCATPVDYITRTNPDGSVSCVVGATDLPSGTKWNVEISVHPDHAYFETKVSWFNNTSLPCTYYHWMNAAAKSSGNLEFLYPGNKKIGHGGELGEWPMENNRDISYYENNDFGLYKSYHIINSYSDFFGGYWHDDDFGFGHWSNYDDKPGKKLWIWGLSQQGMIWEDLLTDNDGQYIEFQAGKLFNQAAHSSTFTPFKHKEFAPHDTDIMYEIWFPLKETGGMVAASPYGILDVSKNGENTRILFSALQEIDDLLVIMEDGQMVSQLQLKLKPLENKVIEFHQKSEHFTVQVGNKLKYSSNSDDIIVDRPTETAANFNWESAYGLFTKALEMEKQRRFDDALVTYKLVIQKDPGYLPALNRIALGYYRKMNYDKAGHYILQSLSIDTYNGEANYLFGLINKKKENIPNSKSGFSIATASVTYRVAAYIELAKLFIAEGNYSKALEYSSKALNFNAYNPVAYQLMVISYRKSNKYPGAIKYLEKLLAIDATIHFPRFEKYLLDKSEEAKKEFTEHITNEMPVESFLELAAFYKSLNCDEEAAQVLNLAPNNPIRNIWLAHLDTQNTSQYISQVIADSPHLVFPYRIETAEILEDLIVKYDNWKLSYYLGLIYWNLGLESQAKDLFESCGTKPDFGAFYVAKARLLDNPEAQKENLLKALSLDENDWRTALALTNFYLENNEGVKALTLSNRFKDKYPLQPSIGLSYARSLMKLSRYNESASFLTHYNLLPFEGATIGRDIYHEACIRMAYGALKNKKYNLAIAWAEKARIWPINLGVGKPYDVDERLDNFIIAQAYEQSGKNKKAQIYYQKLTNHPNENHPNESSKLLLQLLAFDAMDQSSNSETLLTQMISEYPDNQYIHWVQAVYHGQSEKAELIAQEILSSGDVIQPYDISFRDNEFQLLLDFIR